MRNGTFLMPCPDALNQLALRVLSDVLSLDVAEKQPVAIGVPDGEETFLTSGFKPVGRDARKCISYWR
jgi:hypothetical protein